MLFKNETAVGIVIALSAVFASPSFAKERGSDVPDYKEYMSECKESGKSRDDCNKEYRDTLKTISGSGIDKEKSCEKANDEFTKAAGDFAGACPIAGLPGDAAECAKAIKDCGNKKNSRTTGGSRSKICPGEGAELNKFRDEVEKVQEKIADFTKKQAEIDTKKAEITEEGRKTLEKANKEMAEAQSKFAEDQAKRQKELVNQLNAKQKQDFAQMQQMQAQYDNLVVQIKMIPAKKAQVKIEKFDQQVTKLRLECDARAVRAVEELEAKNAALIREGKLMCGGLNGCLAFSGTTDEKRYQDKALEKKLKCIRSGWYDEQVDLFDKAYQAANYAIGIEGEGLEKQKVNLINSINQAKQQSSLDELTAKQMAMVDDNAARTAHQTKMASLQSQIQTASASTQAKLEAKDNEKRQIQTQIDQKNSYLQDKQDILAAVEKHSGGKDFSAADAAKITVGLSKTTQAARSGLSMCCENKDSAPGCRSFADFIDGAGLGPVGWRSSSSSAASIAAAASSEPRTPAATIDDMVPRPAYPPETEFYHAPGTPPVGDDASPGARE